MAPRRLGDLSLWLWPIRCEVRTVAAVDCVIEPQHVEAAALVLAKELEFSVPIELEGDHGWYAVAERILLAAAAASADSPSD
jgi:hypothetical protein